MSPEETENVVIYSYYLNFHELYEVSTVDYSSSVLPYSEGENSTNTVETSSYINSLLAYVFEGRIYQKL